jgi:uncharacterized membrane protein
MKNKRAVSTLIATILLILITALAVIIIWKGLMPQLTKYGEENQKSWLLKETCLNETAIAYCQEKGMEFRQTDDRGLLYLTFWCEGNDKHELDWFRYKFTDEELVKCQTNK